MEIFLRSLKKATKLDSFAENYQFYWISMSTVILVYIILKINFRNIEITFPNVKLRNLLDNA